MRTTHTHTRRFQRDNHRQDYKYFQYDFFMENKKFDSVI